MCDSDGATPDVNLDEVTGKYIKTFQSSGI